MIKLIVFNVISSLTRGGRERQLATIVANIDQARYLTKILYFNKKANSYIDEYGLQDTALQIKQKGKFKRLKELHNILKTEKPDVVYTWGNGESLSILLLKPFHKFKFINGSIRHGIRSQRLSHYFRSLILHLSPNIVANSLAGLRANNLKRGKVLYNGVDPKFIGKLTEAEKKEKRIKLTGIDSETPLLISVANLVPYKDYFTILKALKILKEKGFQFQYIILGDGPLRNEIENTIRQYDLPENIKLPGNVQNVNDYLKIADIFIHSSKAEGCSNAILESMAAGLPVIATATGGNPEIIDHSYGRLFDYKNADQLVNYIIWFLKNPDQFKKMGAKASEKVAKRFSIKKMIKDYEQIIQQVL